jgi:hypothetical protein
MSNRLSDPQQEFQIAWTVFRQGDLSHAAHHLAWALAADATNTQYLGLLDKIIRRADDPLELILAQDTMSYAEAAMRAFILAEQGDVDQAMTLLMQVLGVSPTLSYLPWLVGWLTNSRKLRRLSPEAMTRVLASLGEPVE